MTSGSTRPIVVMSERLGTVGSEERRIEAAGAELRSAPLWDAKQIRSNAADAQVVMVGAVEPFDRAALESLPNCLAVVRRGVGFDNVDAVAATQLGIMVAIVPDASVEEVSDHALALLLAIERRILPLDLAVHQGRWQRDPAAIEGVRNGARRLSDLHLGIVGFGRIGRALARKAAPLYARILAADPVADAQAAQHLGVELVSIDELAGTSEHVSVHAPLGPSTRNIINGGFLGRLSPGSVLVNTSRGGLVDEVALLEAIKSGRLAGAGLDVTVEEPIGAENPLLAHDRIVLTGHSAAASTAAKRELSRRTVDAVVAVLASQQPPYLANPDVTSSPKLRLAALGEG